MSVILILFYSCSSKLKTNEATDLVSKLPNEIVEGKTRLTTRYDIVQETGSRKSVANKGSEYLLEQNQPLIDRGILKEPVTIQKPWMGTYEYITTMDLTDTAKSLVIRDEIISGYRTITVKCGELKFIEVVDIFQEEKTAEIEYKVGFVPTIFYNFANTEISYEKGMTFTRKKTAKKYDNGWKLEN